ncbi:MAG: cation:proton antiporter regulatory subunit [Actinomycetota bacterium]|nr:cation:proton antiporter regulatory subunit [Actinomycetota bacterium]
MGEIRQVKLPGVGVRYEFETEDGKLVEVLSHRTGRREIYIASPDDPDEFKRVLGLSQTEARTMAELLGASRVAEQLAELQQRIEGLVIDWLPVRAGSAYAGRTIGDARIRTRTGVSVVAVVRGDEAVPAPGPQTGIEAGDYLVVVGTARGIEQVVELLHRG